MLLPLTVGLRTQTRADERAHAHVSAPHVYVRRAMFGLRMQEAEPVNREQVNYFILE
jgi:hypothetical protein